MMSNNNNNAIANNIPMSHPAMATSSRRTRFGPSEKNQRKIVMNKSSLYFLNQLWIYIPISGIGTSCA